MKAFRESGRICLRLPTALGVFLIFAAAFATGCGKQKVSAPPVPPPESTATTPAAPSPTVSAPAPHPQSATTAAPNSSQQSLQVLNQALMRWMIKNRRHPRSFEEFASTANIQIPAPPPGKKYALNGRGFIVLVDVSTQ
ncbi:MAG: hypothetical protein ACREFR_19895 [Limisphaerales bacterium]